MKRTVFHLKFVTPALIAGARPKTDGPFKATAELRSASIRGQLRWWHRFLGHDPNSEKRIYGEATGGSGTASGVLIRVVDPPDAVSAPKSARDLGLHPQNGIVEYLAFNLRKNGDQRSALPEGTEFHLLLQSRKLDDADWKVLLHTVEVFSWLGSLGSRSRRCFGALTLLARDGKKQGRPESWDALLAHSQARACVVAGITARDWRDLMRGAGKWLRDQRANCRNKNTLFGTAGRNSRRASSILIRPDEIDGNFQLLAIGKAHDLQHLVF